MNVSDRDLLSGPLVVRRRDLERRGRKAEHDTRTPALDRLPDESGAVQPAIDEIDQLFVQVLWAARREPLDQRRDRYKEVLVCLRLAARTRDDRAGRERGLAARDSVGDL